MDNTFLNYYNDELENLRKIGAHFAEANPKIANKLRHEQQGVSDPFVERLIEGVSFINAATKKTLNEKENVIAKQFINLLYPQALKFIPSFSQVTFKLNPDVTENIDLPKHTLLETLSDNNEACHFQTLYPTCLNPIEINDADYQKVAHKQAMQKHEAAIKASFKLDIKSLNSETTLEPCKNKPWRFYFKLDNTSAGELLTQIHYHLLEAQVLANDKRYLLPKTAIKHVGLSDEDCALNYFDNSNAAMTRMSDYFHLRRRFFYVDIDLSSLSLDTNSISLIFLLKRYDDTLEKRIDKNTIQTNCAPIINLFPLDGEPLRLNETQTYQKIIPSAHRPEKSLEIYHLKGFEISSHEKSLHCAPYFAKHIANKPDNTIYWQAETMPCWASGKPHLLGNDTYVHFSDAPLSASNINQIALLPNLICSNRDLYRYIQTGSSFTIKNADDSAIKSCELLESFTPPIYITPDQHFLKKLMHFLTNQHIDLTDEKQACEQIKCLLRLCMGNDTQLESSALELALLNINTEGSVSRHPEKLKAGFCYGVKTTITVNEAYLPDNNAYLFGEAVNQLLKGLCRINSFTQVSLKNKDGKEIHTWPITLGNQTLL